MSKYTAFFSSLAAATTFSVPALADPVISGDDVTVKQQNCMLGGMAEILPSSQPEFSKADAFNGLYFSAIAHDVTMSNDEGVDEPVRVNSIFWFSTSGEPQNDVSVVAENGHVSSGLLGQPVTGSDTLLIGGGRSAYSQNMESEVHRVYSAMQSLAAQCLTNG